MSGKKKGVIQKDEYTVTEVGTLIEEFRSEFKVFGEKLQANTEKLDATYEQVGKITEQMILLETAVRNVIARIEELTKGISELVKTKADREEMQLLDKRISALENKVAVLAR